MLAIALIDVTAIDGLLDSVSGLIERLVFK